MHPTCSTCRILCHSRTRKYRPLTAAEEESHCGKRYAFCAAEQLTEAIPMFPTHHEDKPMHGARGIVPSAFGDRHRGKPETGRPEV